VPGAERCDCFTFDPLLEQAGFSRYTTADYTGAGAALGQGVGIDRGHLARSADRTVGALDNARTFYFSNIIPQFSDNNQGPWAAHETFLGNIAETQNKEVFIYAGGAGNLGSVKGEGLITIPAWTWKVSVVAPAGTRLEDVRDYRDLEVIAVVMPNAMGIRNVNWQTSYVVTADSVERLTGYRFLSALPEKTRRALITGTQPPLGAIAPVSGLEGAPVAFDASGSVDPNGTIVSYEWSFGDGSTGTGVAPSHTYDFFGTYTVQLVTTDNDGLVDTVSTTINVAQVTPAQGIAQVRAAIAEFATAAGLNRGQTQSLSTKVSAAEASIARGNVQAALGQLGALRNELQALVNSGRATAAQIEVIELAVERVERATR
jgi:DNA/RNA endonuclease G (NUC1)